MSESTSDTASSYPSPAPREALAPIQIREKTAALALGALGVDYGDIGTSPLYAVRECFNGPHAVAINPTNLLGSRGWAR